MLALRVRGEGLLDSYQSERHPNAREYITTAVRLGGLINTCGTEAALRVAMPAADGTARMESVAPPLGPGSASAAMPDGCLSNRSCRTDGGWTT